MAQTRSAQARAVGPFAPVAVLSAIVVGMVALCAMLVLAAYAPELRGDHGGGASALSKSAVGFVGLERAMRAMGAPVSIGRDGPPRRNDGGAQVIVITPDAKAQPGQTRPFARASGLIVVLPKWVVIPAPGRPGFVGKVAPFGDAAFADRMLNPFSTSNRIARRGGVSQATVRRVDPTTGALGPPMRLAAIDRLQTISGEGWRALLIDENGRMLAAISQSAPNVVVVAEPDLLNNHGLSKRETARVALPLIDSIRGDRAMVFDVTLNGFKSGDTSLLRLALEPPWLAATLCALAAAVMVFLHALGRFGRPADEAPAHGAGRRALVENTAAMVRMARKEPQMAPLYAQLVFRQVGDASGLKRGDDAQRDQWLEEVWTRRGLESPAALAAQAAAAKTRDDLIVVAQKLHDWKKGASSGGR